MGDRAEKSNSAMMYIPELNASVRINDQTLPPSTAEMVRQLIRSTMGIDDISGNDSIDLGILAEYGMPLIQNNMLQIRQREERTWRSTTGHNQRMTQIRKFRDILGQEMTPEQRGKGLPYVYDRYGSY